MPDAEVVDRICSSCEEVALVRVGDFLMCPKCDAVESSEDEKPQWPDRLET